MFERTGGRKRVDADEVQHEDSRALEVNDEDLARERGNKKKKRAQEEDLDHGNGEERLDIPKEMIWSNAGMVRPGSECAEEAAEDHSRKCEDGRNKRASPATPEVRELRYRLGEQDLNRVTLKIAQDRCAEDRGYHDYTEEACADVVIGVRVRTVEQNLAIGITDRAEALARDTEELEGEP